MHEISFLPLICLCSHRSLLSLPFIWIGALFYLLLTPFSIKFEFHIHGSFSPVCLHSHCFVLNLSFYVLKLFSSPYMPAFCFIHSSLNFPFLCMDLFSANVMPLVLYRIYLSLVLFLPIICVLLLLFSIGFDYYMNGSSLLHLICIFCSLIDYAFLSARFLICPLYAFCPPGSLSRFSSYMHGSPFLPLVYLFSSLLSVEFALHIHGSMGLFKRRRSAENT